jgi:hypothetical protein
MGDRGKKQDGQDREEYQGGAAIVVRGS